MHPFRLHDIVSTSPQLMPAEEYVYAQTAVQTVRRMHLSEQLVASVTSAISAASMSTQIVLAMTCSTRTSHAGLP